MPFELSGFFSPESYYHAILHKIQSSVTCQSLTELSSAYYNSRLYLISYLFVSPLKLKNVYLQKHILLSILILGPPIVIRRQLVAILV